MLLAMQLAGSLCRGPIEDRNMIRSITCEHLRPKSIKPHISLFCGGENDDNDQTEQ